MWQLQNFDIDDFLANYWQRKPLLIRQALPGFNSVLTPEELAGLACEPGVSGRLVIEKDADTPWHVQYGPFQETDFTRLPPTHYSLLVAECEKWLPELQPLVDCFDFIPHWRFDDLMISYAPDQGSVGPHVDEYDVFLLQGSGQRKWSINHQAVQNPAIIDGLELAILQQFEADESWTLAPGDMLYLPPGIAHHGVAIGDGCMTYSIGFRAHQVSDVIDSFQLEADAQGLTHTRYRDVTLNRNRHPYEIRTEDILQYKAMVYQALDQSTALWPDIVGKLLSDSTLSEDVETLPCDSFEQATQFLWQKHPDARFFYHADEQQVRLYANGQLHALPQSPENIDFCQWLCQQRLFPLDSLEQTPDPTHASLLLQLINQHALIPVIDDE